MRAFITGVILATVLLVAAYATPSFLRADHTRIAALEQAELARRQLHRYDAMLPVLATVSDATGADKLQTLLGSNRKLLDEAGRAAREASSSGEGVIGAAQVEGMVKLAEAAAHLVESRRLRREMEAQQNLARALALDWAEAGGQKDHNEALSGAKPIEGLRGDKAEIEAQLGEAEKFATGLAEAIKSSEGKLSQIKGELDLARTEALAAQAQGFTPGDDSAFASYRERLSQVSARLVELQEQEQLLAAGGLLGATAPDDMLQGEFEGGKPVLGLDELKRQDAILQDRVARLNGALKTLEGRIQLIEGIGAAARQVAQQRSTQQSELQTGMGEALSRLAELHGKALEREDQALKAARDAAQAFRKSKTAVDGWLRDVRELQQEKDPQRLNERIKRILDDKVVEVLAPSAEAEAQALLGRIQTERFAGATAYLDTLERMAQLARVSAATEELIKLRDTSREEGVTALNAAREGYEKLAKRESATSWILEGSLATVYHLLSQIDVGNREQYLVAASESIRKATDKRESSPYARELMVLRRLLLGDAAAAPAPTDADASPEGEPEAAEPAPAEEAGEAEEPG